MPKSQQELGQQRKTLRANAEKALRLKRKAGAQTNIPEHQTAGSGPIAEGQVRITDARVGREPTWTPNLKRSHNARRGDG